MTQETISKIIETLQDDGADSYESMVFALQDGEYLSRHDWSQEEVEEAFDEVLALSSK